MGLWCEGTELGVIKAAKVVLFIDIITYSIQLGGNNDKSCEP